MTNDALPVLRLSGSDDMLTAVPYLLGFVPQESLVILTLKGRKGRLGFHCRVDLPDRGDEAALASFLAPILGRNRADHCFVVIYRDATGPPDRADHAVVDALRPHLRRLRMEPVDLLAVRRDRWWSLECSDASCCPLEGQLLPDRDPAAGASRVQAELVLRGRTAVESRADLEHALGPGDPARVAAVERCCERYVNQAGWRRWTNRCWPAALDRYSGTRRFALDAEDIARLLVPLQRLDLRDRAASYCLRRPDAALRLLRDVVRCSPTAFVAAPATILGLVSWSEGDGLTAGIAFQRALAADPSYAFAVLLDHALQHGVRMPDEFRAEICRYTERS